MKKNVLLGAAVAGLFATSAFAGKPMKGVTTEAGCTTKKGTWNADKKECDASCKGSCGSKSSKSTTKSTTETKSAPSDSTMPAPSTTTPAN